MASLKISQMQAADALNATDVLPIVTAQNDNKKITGAKLKTFTNDGMQASTDNNLQTDSKTVVGAINELDAEKADKDNIIVRYVELFNNVQTAADTEYNSNGSTIPHVTIPTISGYSVLDVINVRARGYYGSRGVLYAWIEQNMIHFSLYNASNRNDATFIGDCWLLYRKN